MLPEKWSILVFCSVNSPFVKEAVALEISKIKNTEVRRQANLSSEFLA